MRQYVEKLPDSDYAEDVYLSAEEAQASFSRCTLPLQEPAGQSQRQRTGLCRPRIAGPATLTAVHRQRERETAVGPVGARRDPAHSFGAPHARHRPDAGVPGLRRALTLGVRPGRASTDATARQGACPDRLRAATTWRARNSRRTTDLPVSSTAYRDATNRGVGATVAPNFAL